MFIFLPWWWHSSNSDMSTCIVWCRDISVRDRLYACRLECEACTVKICTLSTCFLLCLPPCQLVQYSIYTYYICLCRGASLIKDTPTPEYWYAPCLLVFCSVYHLVVSSIFHIWPYRRTSIIIEHPHTEILIWCCSVTPELWKVWMYITQLHTNYCSHISCYMYMQMYVCIVLYILCTLSCYLVTMATRCLRMSQNSAMHYYIYMEHLKPHVQSNYIPCGTLCMYRVLISSYSPY